MVSSQGGCIKTYKNAIPKIFTWKKLGVSPFPSIESSWLFFRVPGYKDGKCWDAPFGPRVPVANRRLKILGLGDLCNPWVATDTGKGSIPTETNIWACCGSNIEHNATWSRFHVVGICGLNFVVEAFAEKGCTRGGKQGDLFGQFLHNLI